MARSFMETPLSQQVFVNLGRKSSGATSRAAKNDPIAQGSVWFVFELPLVVRLLL